MTKHAYLTTILISDKRSAFLSHVIKEVADVIGITLKHATTKRAKAIGMFKQSHVSTKQALRIETSAWKSLWHKNISIAVLDYNTPYHASIGCEPSRVFRGRISYNVLDLKMSILSQKMPTPISKIVQDVLKQTEMVIEDVRKNAIQAYVKNETYYA